MARTAFLVTSALAVAALGFQMSTAHGKHSWGNYHWERSSNPIALELGDNVTGDLTDIVEDDWKDLLNVASKDWSESSVLNTTVGAGMSNRNCKAVDGRVEVCNASYGNTGWLGLAQIWISGDHITKGIAKLNDSYLSSGGSYDTPQWRGLVMCQEVGHTFGLGHQNEDFDTNDTKSCMEYTRTPEGNEHPDQHDYDELKLIYEHLDEPTSTVIGPGKGNGRGNGKVVSVSGFEFAAYVRDDPDDWGQAIAFTSKGQPRLFVKNLGEGEKRITHVLWTEDAQAGRHFPHQH